VRLKEHQMAFAKDPVCGMEVDTDTELKVEYDGETYYFCSRGCKLDFEEDPEKYLDPTYEPHM
jgi:Cu+-exporting ATPase